MIGPHSKPHSLSLISLAVAITSAADAAILSNPMVTASADPFSGAYVADNLFDGNRDSEFATSGNGAGTAFSTDPNNGTWVEMDFGSTVTADRFFAVTRRNNADVIGQSRLVLSTDAVFDGTDTLVTIDPTGQNGGGPLASFSQTSFRYARWEALTSTGGSLNLGAQEMRFLNTPAGSLLTPSSVIGGAPAYSGNYALANAANDNFGRDGSGFEYASATQGLNMFVDFDLGSTVPINGFDLFQRGAGGDLYTGFDLIFSNDPTFTSTVGTSSFTISGLQTDATFAAVDARYVRLDATAGGSGNTGVTEMVFYQVPEPSFSGLLGLLGSLILLRRKR